MPRIETSSPHPSCVETRGDESLAKRIVMAARSVKVQFETEEMPNTKLVLVGSGLSHGEWSSGLQPPESLPPGFAIEWQSEVRRIFDGNPSWVRYYPVTPGGNAPANPPAEDTIYITWDNPYSGGNSYSSTAPSPYSISGGSVLDYNADNEMAVFTLSLPASSRVVTHRRHLPISPQHPREASSSSPTSRPIRATICS